MSTWLIAVVTIIYLAVALSFAIDGKWMWFIVWFGYALANVGFILMGIYGE